MNPDIKVAEPLPNYKLKVQFTNNELKEFDAMLSSIDSFRVYLNRTKILSKDRINRFKNYL